MKFIRKLMSISSKVTTFTKIALVFSNTAEFFDKQMNTHFPQDVDITNKQDEK